MRNLRLSASLCALLGASSSLISAPRPAMAAQAPNPATWTVVTLKGGQVYKGVIVGRTATTMTMRLEGGGTVTITLADILSVTTQVNPAHKPAPVPEAKPADVRREMPAEPVAASPAAPMAPAPRRHAAKMAGPGRPVRPPPPPNGDPQGTEDYADYGINKPTATKDDKLSTFAVDVDTASYTIARRKILGGEVVPQEAVRLEEFVNYFRYSYAGPTAKDRAFEVHTDGAPSPFAPGKHIVRIGVQGKTVAPAQRKRAHLVFLVDVSGSMMGEDRLPLAQRSLRLLVDNLQQGDTVALVTYAGSTRVVLPPTGMDQRDVIMDAIDGLTAGGSTAMASGIQLAYELAARTLSKDTISRVIILSDGDANVGTTGHEAILNSIAEYVKKGVTLSTVGFGMGNYKDTRMEQLANKGNGENYYIDSLSAAKRVFQEQLGGTLEVIAQDVKLQVEWNPATVKTYRLLGYENRDIADQDFRNDKVDAGEIGAGHTVTALYEIELAPAADGPLATVRIRAKKPGGKEAAEWAFPTTTRILGGKFDAASADFRFACAVAGFAEILRGSPYAKGWKLADVARIAKAAAGGAEDRQEFVALVGKAKLAP
jgi:Ca-activated chloride channel family protein